MRLTETERNTIRQIVRKYDPTAQVRLYGSRVDNAAKGGDIDLLIISDLITASELSAIRWELWERLGEQKIDLILSDTLLTSTFARHAYGQGVSL